MSASPTEMSRRERLERWERRANPFIVVAAIVPIVVAFTRDPTEGVTPFVDIASWLVFAVDLAVHMRLSDRYLATGRGKFDLGIVVLTFPWYLLLPGSDATQVLALARLARLGRIAMVAVKGSRGLRRFAQRLGKAAAAAGIVTFTCALIVYNVESPADGFKTFGDSLWWAIVTVTTVGYGDLVPQTTAGRVTAAFLMVSGLAFLGALAGSLAALLGVSDDAPVGPDDPEILDEIRALRRQVEALSKGTSGDD
ncbi:MAG TPA: potassium channel family protein [Actinomycetota bacterium]|nr:potassium channel family protein [Actinomycetota bacterium]